MIKKTIEISRQAVHLSAKLDQLIVQPFDEPKESARSIPCEDIGVLVIDEPRCSITQGAMEALLRHGAVVVVCGRNHLPAGLLLPTNTHTEQVQRLGEQIGTSQPTRKRLWKQLVQNKVANHAAIHAEDPAASRKLRVLVKEVRSGDTTNVEGQAARVHWEAWRRSTRNLNGFKRNPDGADTPNALLNYGYAILRAAVARAIVSAGLHPALGLHHHNRSNAYCLADDLMEPLRPLIDRRAQGLLNQGCEELDQSAKAVLLGVLIETVVADDQRGPLMVALPQLLGSLVRCYRKESDRLLSLVLPEADV